MAKDVRALREEAAEATASGKYKRALAAYLELERLEPRDAQWAKRAGETYRRLGNNKHAIEAFERSADRYAQNGFLVQAIAVCKLVLQIDPQHAEALRRLAQMNEQLGAGPTRAAGMAENNPALHENPNVNALRRSTGNTVNPRTKVPTRQPGEKKEPTGRTPVVREGAAGAGTGSTPTIGRTITPVRATTVPSRTTPAVGVPARSTPSQGTPPSTVRTTPSQGTPSSAPRTTPSQGTPSSAPRTTPLQGTPSGGARTTPLQGTPSSTARTTPIAVTRSDDARARTSGPIVTPRAATPVTPREPTRAPSQQQPAPRLEPAQPRQVTPMPPASEPMPALSRTRSPNLAVSRTKTSTPPVVAIARTKSKPISLPPGAAIDQVKLSAEVPESQLRDESTPGIHIIPIDEASYGYEYEYTDDPTHAGVSIGEDTLDFDRASGPIIEIEPPDERIEAEIEEQTELELADIEEIPLPEPLYMGVQAHKALQATPLFAGLPSDALEALVSNLELVHLDEGAVLFHEGDTGDALYVIVEGEVSVQAEGPPRVEMARLGAGAFIGEVALMTDQPRSATVSAVSNAELLRIDRHTLGRVLANHGDVLRAVLRFVRDRLVDRWMRTSPLFRPFDEAARSELAAKFNFLEIEDGTRLIEAGTKPDGLYIVLAGQFAVERDGATLATLGAGELIGETALLQGGTFKSHITARGKSLALHLPAGEFREIIMTHPHVLEYIGEHADHSRRLQIL